MQLKPLSFIAVFLTFLLVLVGSAFGCTRVTYVGPEDTIITGRTMDWGSDIGSNLWVFPRGMERDGAAGPNSVKWSSLYGSVVASAFDAATVDGMNEKGLVVNLLYLVESQYPKPKKGDPRSPISIAAWAQYVLDRFATVKEAVKALSQEPFYVVPTMTPDGHTGHAHLAISDLSGDSAIFEYLEGKLVIHHGKEYQVMTNSPSFDKQLALCAYWQEIGGLTMLPGTNRASDRFVRAAFYIDAIPKTSDIRTALAGVLGVIRNASVPLGISTPDKPNISSTLWRTLADHKNRRYYFDGVLSPSLFWVDLDKLDLAEGAPVLHLPLKDVALGGEASGNFETSTPFEFLEAQP
ncbi:Choloylglycine hydrolase [Dethiosulfovibrio peptidovorans DSM 11002]|uniref:Choloylglycine hydrolase n=1 Tax=Dethiosulfovibrio peptidovorans DSM 11002 TaxID=469381 RepID=D2Z6H8_9BACT|nr:linear amide C-N hydrolase [Dethiosulfovibrio peptidovorans]EFC91075.1 Choloylglycine hydrolase [Dethiosulfovibrio peptidovorans DSM 11002]